METTEYIIFGVCIIQSWLYILQHWIPEKELMGAGLMWRNFGTWVSLKRPYQIPELQRDNAGQ